MGVNSLPKTVTRHRHECYLNRGPSAPGSSTLTTQLPRHVYICLCLLLLQPAYQRRQDQSNSERPHSVPHTHSEWTTGAGGYVPVPWVPDYRRWWVYDRIPYQVKQIGSSSQIMWKSQSIPIVTKIRIRLMKALVWPVVTYGCESWTLSKNEETRNLSVCIAVNR